MSGMSTETEPKKKGRKARIALGIVLFLLVSGYFLFPVIVCAISWPTFSFDLTDALGEKAKLFDRRSLRLTPVVSRQNGQYLVRAEGRLLDWPLSVNASIKPGWWLSATGKAEVALEGTPWHADVRFAAPSLREWNADVTLPETRFDEQDPVLQPILEKLALSSVSNLVFSGSLKVDAKAGQTKARPVPVWNATARIKGVDAALFASGQPVAVKNLNLHASGFGIADHYDIHRLHPRADAVEAAGFTLTNFYATVIAETNAYLVTEAGGDFCGGKLRAYSVRIDPESLSTGFTLTLDGIDAGETLSHVAGFRGTATGRLNGRVQLYLRNGEELRLRDSYVYSVPGETGKIRIDDASPITDGLAVGGVPDESRDNLAKALADLDYTVLKMNLSREEGNSLALAFKLDGSATRGSVTVPVSFGVTFHGDLEQLINTGLKVAK